MGFWNMKDYREAKRRGDRAILIGVFAAVVLLPIIFIIVAWFS